MRGQRWELWGELFTQVWFMLCWFEILVQPRALRRQLGLNPLFLWEQVVALLQHNSNMQNSQRCLALCGEAFHVSSMSGTATEKNHGIPEPWLEWSSGDPLFQPAGQAALRSGCSGPWLEHPPRAEPAEPLWATCSSIRLLPY